ncbi:MAG: dienelactone hydrolase family protein [Streptomycetaceae bacterium]|nr:dienelactone hydrolase family protein [Streptomycetaceae bacterium]
MTEVTTHQPHQPGQTGLTVLLMHSAYGLRPPVLDAARTLERHGHRVIVPDLYYGTPVASPEGGLALRDRIGLPELLSRARRESQAMGARRVYAGFSLGAWLAQQLANNDPDAAGLLLLHGLSAPPGRPRDRPLPVQLHLGSQDVSHMPWLRDWQVSVRRTGHLLQTYIYPDTAHLFTDTHHSDHSAAATAAAWQRSLSFLAALVTHTNSSADSFSRGSAMTRRPEGAA